MFRENQPPPYSVLSEASSLDDNPPRSLGELASLVLYDLSVRQLFRASEDLRNKLHSRHERNP